MSIYLRNGTVILGVDPEDIKRVSRTDAGWVAVIDTPNGYQAIAVATWQGPELYSLKKAS